MKGPINLSYAQWAHVNNSNFVLSRAMVFVAQLHWKKEYWLHLPQFMKLQDTQPWCITFAGGNKSKRCPGNKHGTHAVLNLAAEVQWHFRRNVLTAHAPRALISTICPWAAVYFCGQAVCNFLEKYFEKPQTPTFWRNRVENFPVF